MNRLALTYLAVGGALAACQPTERAQTTPPTLAFYHWKTTFAPTPTDRAALDSLGAKTLYIRFFDVDWNTATHAPVPKAGVIFRQPPGNIRVVPVVYITNQTMAFLRPNNVPDLARQMVRKLIELADKQQIILSKIQLDCDWTRTTRHTYFALLRAVGQQARVPLSATIRLHQVKFAGQTGVPPVQRGMLMAYNTGDWKQPTTRNSILDLRDLTAYAHYLPGYPLPLDVALPLFRWTVAYRNNRFLALLNNVDNRALRGKINLQPQIDSTRFVVLTDTLLNGVALRRGDLLRTEAISAQTLRQTTRLLLSQLPDQKRTFTLYHLDSTLLHSYRYADLYPPRRP